MMDMNRIEPAGISRHFSPTYADARRQFLEASRRIGLDVESHVLDAHRGAENEVLATDVARFGAADAAKLLIISSGTHGPEGFCGSGVQAGLLHDADLRDRLTAAGVALLLIHAVNPYGFSYLQRTNEDNIDPNRNCLNFSDPLPVNARYPEVEALLIPQTWPPTADNALAIAAYVREHGYRAYREALTSGQSVSPDGMFYAGIAPCWSNRTMRKILRQHASRVTDIGWIDIHTGLGPYGHGEKIFAGRNNAAEIARARAWWGPDVLSFYAGESVSMEVRGSLVSTVYDECSANHVTLTGLEFGTRPDDEVLQSLRASTWAGRQADLDVDVRARIRRQTRDAFYCDCDEWKGMIYGQARTIALQTLLGLKAR